MPGQLIRACSSPQLPALLRAHPGIELGPQGNDAQQGLAAEGVDIAIRLDSSDGQPGLVTRKLMRFRWIICVPPVYLESTGEFASPADLTRRHQMGFRDAGLGLFMMCQLTESDGGSSVQDVPRDRLVVEDMTTI